MIGHFLTDQGRVRSHNEDSGGVFYNTENQLLAIIADGMGGHRAGDVASQMATELICEKWKVSEAFTAPDKAEEWITNVLKDVNEIILQTSKDKQECQGMGTTVVISICTDEFITVAHVGDSRCYLLNNNGFNQVTEDHSLVNELVRSGQISKADADYHPRKNVLLKALGTEVEVVPDVKTLEWEKDDKILLCSDGLTNKVLDDEIKGYIDSNKDIKEIGSDLVNLANKRGGEDNVSLVIVSYEPSEKVGEDSC